MIARLLSVALLLAFVAAPAHATIYKCNVKGRIAYQEQPCDRAGNGDVMSFNGPGTPSTAEAPPTPEERAWAERVRPSIVSASRAGGGGRRLDKEPLTREQVKRMCECTANLYFTNNSLARLRELEAKGDEAGSMKLMRPLLVQCEKNALAAEEAEEQP